MKSDFRTPTKGPLWPLIWALPLLLTILNTVSSEKSVYTKDSHWIPLDKNFPPTTNELNSQELSRFFYARGQLDSHMNLTADALATILREPAENYHVKFQIFRSKLQCVKYFAVGKENITIIENEGADWSRIDRHYTAEEFVQFQLFLSAGKQCEQLVMAIKDLTVTYNRYEKDTRNESNNANKQLFKDLTFTKPTEPKAGWKTFFHDCNQANVCNFTVPANTIKEKNVEITFWHSHSKKIEVTDDKNTNTIEPNKEGQKFIITKDTTIKNDVIVKINVKEDIDNFHSIVAINGQFKSKNFFAIENNQETFFQNHLDTKILIDYGQVASAAVLFNRPTKPFSEKTCYTLDYIISPDKNVVLSKYRLSVEIHGDQPNQKYVNRYDLFDFTPVVDNATHSVHFCLRDYLFKPDELGAKGQLLLESISATSKTPDIRLAMVALTEKDDNNGNKEQKFIKADDNEKWVSQVAEAALNDPKEPSIKATTGETVHQLRTVWLEKQDKLHIKDVHLQLVIDSSATTEDHNTLLKQTALSALVCDDINECSIMKESHQQKEGNLEYRLNFDGHPRKESTHLKLQLTVKLPKVSKEVSVKVNLISFGDPCYENTLCPSNDANKKCENDVTKNSGLSANEFAKACQCKKAGHSGDKCEVVNYCIAKSTESKTSCGITDEKNIAEVNSKCRNNRENKDFECICPLDPMKIAGQTPGTCVEDEKIKSVILIDPAESTKTKTSKWSYNLEFIRKDFYDFCFQLKRSEKDDVIGTLSLALQLKDSTSTKIELIKSQTLLNHQGQESSLIDVCLGNFIDLETFEIDKWDLEIQVTTETEVAWKKSDFLFHGKGKQEPKDRLTTFPANPQNNLYVKLSSSPKQTVNINAAPIGTGKVKVDTYLFSDWIDNNKFFNEDQIKRNNLKLTDLSTNLQAAAEICQPRTGAKLDCQLYDESSNNLPQILNSLSSNKFQIKLHIYTATELEKADLNGLKVTTEVSFWDSCKLVEQNIDGCHNDATCKNYQSTFICNSCDTNKYSGDRCQYKKANICDQKAVDTCKAIGTECEVVEDKARNPVFQCRCPSGYVFNATLNQCDRMKVNNIEWTCTPGNCFISGLTSDPFVYLPRYFPRLDKTETNNRLYFTTATDSRLTVSVSELDASKAANQDVCIQFKHFIGPNSSLTVRFNDQLDLLTIDGNVPIPSSATKDISLPMTKSATKVCIRPYLPLGKMVDLTAFNLALITHITDKEEAVALELLPFTADDQYHQLESISLPEHGLNYLARHSKDVEGASSNDLAYQWPARFPDRWTPMVDGTGYHYNRRTDSYPAVIEMAILESSWIDRPLKVSGQSAFSKVFLNFKIDNAQYNDENFKVDIYVLDSNRRTIGGVLNTITAENFTLTKPARSTEEFAIPVNRDIEKGKLYKVQFHIKYKDEQSPVGEKSSLFDIKEISFGDPCIAIDESKKTGAEQICYNYDEKNTVDPILPDKDIKCKRNLKTSGAMDYHCECKNSNLHGKNCNDADYCQLKHPVPFVQNGATTLTPLKGDEFCIKNVKTVKCGKNVIKTTPEYKFMCICDDTKQKFNYDTQKCDPIDACSLNACDFETQICKTNSTNQANCFCKTGFELKDGVCKPVNQEGECSAEDRASVSGCDDPNMRCLYNSWGEPFCRCAKGFVDDISKETKKPICVSDMCNFAGLHSCPQGCSNTTTPPYFECKCDENSDKVATKEGNVDVTECKVKTSSPCTGWSGRYKTCTSGVKGCAENYRLNEKGDECVPKPTYRMTACPNHFAYRFDGANSEYACNCKNTSDYFVDDPALRSTCTITKSVCSAGEPGRRVCNARGAGCLVNPLTSVDDYTCACHIGSMFADVTQYKSAALVKANPKAACVDVCDLPFKKSQCAAIGAQCNPIKLWPLLQAINSQPNMLAGVPSESYCDCVPGTFYDSAFKSCIQEPKALNLNITFLWSDSLNKEYEERKRLSHLGAKQPTPSVSKIVGLENIDPIGFAHVEQAAIRLNREEEALKTAAWDEQILLDQLNTEANLLFSIFNLAKQKNQIDQDVQALSLKRVELNGKLAYTVQLAAKIPDHLQLADSELQLYSSVTSEGDDDELQADAAATTAAPATTTPAPTTTTGAPDRDRSLQTYNLTIYNNLIDYCASVDANTGKCVISFGEFFDTPLYLHKEAVKPTLHEPCDYEGACNGMSNCHPLSGSTFECRCGDHFEAELRYTFKSKDSNIIYRNEYCRAQDLCTSNCLDGDKAHTKCQHIAPSRASVASPWVNSYSCDCVDKYVPQGANNGTCTYVCATLNCGGGDHGECVPAAKSASCRCKEGFYGEHCQHTVGSNTWWIVGIVVLGVLALAAIGAAVFFWRSSNNKSTRSSPPNHHNSQNPTLVTDDSRQAANIRRITAKADLTSVEQYEGNRTTTTTTAETSTENNHHHSTTEPEHSQNYKIISHNQHQITTVESTHQQKSAPPESNLSSEPSGLEPGQLQLQTKTSSDQDSTTTTSTSSSSSSAEENNSQNRFSSNTARSSFVSAGDLDSVLSRQTSINSLTVHEPFTPYNASPRSTAMYGGGARRSIVVPIIEENERELHKSRFSHSTNRSSSTSSSSSSESSSKEEKKVKTTAETASGPPEPGNAVFTTAIKKEEEDTSSSSGGSSSLELPTEPSSTSLAGPPEPSTKNLQQPQQQQQPNQDLLRDSQEMDSAKFQHVRARIAAVLKLNSNRTYKVSQPSSPEVGRR